MYNSEETSKFKTILIYLRERRKELKLSQKDVAVKLKINTSAFNLMEKYNQKMPAEIFLALCCLLDVNWKKISEIWLKGETLGNQNLAVDSIQKNEISFLQKHIEDCHILMEQQQRIIDKLTSRESD